MTHKRVLCEVYRDFSSSYNKMIPMKVQLLENELVPYNQLKLKIIKNKGELKLSLGDKIVSTPIVSYEGFVPFMKMVIDSMNKWKSKPDFMEYMKYCSTKYALVRAIEDSIPSETLPKWHETTGSLTGMYDFIIEIADQNAAFQNQIIKNYAYYMNQERIVLKNENIRFVPEVPDNIKLTSFNILAKVNMNRIYVYPFEDILTLLKFIANMEKTPVICSLSMSNERPINTALILYAFRNLLYTHKTSLRLKCFDPPVNDGKIHWESTVSKKFTEFVELMENPMGDHIANHPQWYLELRELGQILAEDSVSEILSCTATELTRSVFNI